MRKFLVLLVVGLFLGVGIAYAEQDVHVTLGSPGATQRVASSDTSRSLLSVLTVTSGQTPKRALVTVETYDLRVSFVDAAVQTGGSERGHVIPAGNSIWLDSLSAINSFKFLNKTNGSNAILQITYWY